MTTPGLPLVVVFFIVLAAESTAITVVFFWQREFWGVRIVGFGAITFCVFSLWLLLLAPSQVQERVACMVVLVLLAVAIGLTVWTFVYRSKKSIASYLRSD